MKIKAGAAIGLGVLSIFTFGLAAPLAIGAAAGAAGCVA